MISFFKKLWPAGLPGYIVLWRLPDRKSYYSKDFAELTTIAQQWDSAGFDVFYGVGAREKDLGSTRLGKDSQIVAWPGVWIDIDIAQEASTVGAHASQELPTFEEAERALESFHVPSIVIHSGYGFHAYYLFDVPVPSAEANQFKRVLKATQARFRELLGGKHLDNTATLSRVLRVPGTHNHKIARTPSRVETLVGN